MSNKKIFGLMAIFSLLLMIVYCITNFEMVKSGLEFLVYMLNSSNTDTYYGLALVFSPLILGVSLFIPFMLLIATLVFTILFIVLKDTPKIKPVNYYPNTIQQYPNTKQQFPMDEIEITLEEEQK